MSRRLQLLLLALVVVSGCQSDYLADAQARGWIFVVLGAFGAGFLTSLTPCVYPMIPITLAIFGARGKDVPRKRAITLAVAYVGGMCVMYAALGVTFAMIGKAGAFGTQLASPWVVFPLVALFLTLAASMFGAFELNLPSGLQARLNRIGGKGFGGAFAMGLVGGLIAAPCTGPFLASLLIYVSTSGNALGGGGLLFTYGLGMGVLFFILAAFAVALPKSGAWMDAVKSIGGIGLLFACVYYLMPFLPWLRDAVVPTTGFVIVAIAVAVVGVAAGAIHKSFHGSWGERAQKGFAVAMVLSGAVAIWLWRQAPKHQVTWETDEAGAIAKARSEHKLLMIDFSASWCNPCHAMERTFGTDDVYAAITHDFVPLKFEVTKQSDINDALKLKYDSLTLPSVIFMDPNDGTVLQRILTEVDGDEMLKVVRSAAARQTTLERVGC